MLKLKVSGSYIKDGSTSDYFFDDVYMPDCPSDWVQLNAMRRAVPMRLRKEGIQFDYLRSCYVDGVESFEKMPKTATEEQIKDYESVMSFSKIGIKDYSHEDCQNCAIFFQLLEVPIYRSVDIRESRQKTYRAYCNLVLQKELSKDYDYLNSPDIRVDLKMNKKREKILNNEQFLENESQKIIKIE